MKKFFILLFIICVMPLSAFAKSVINVAFTIDNNYPIYTLLAINSILMNNKSHNDYVFYIVENNLTDENKKMMSDFVVKRKQNIKFVDIDTSVIDGGDYFFGFSTNNRITPIAMARIMLPELLDIDRVLYLDADILVNSDLEDLFFINLDDKLAGLAPNITEAEGIARKLMGKNERYYNSGVILMDLNKWRKEKITKKMLTYIKDNKEAFLYKGVNDGTKFLYPDQDLINVILSGKIKKLPQRWNNQTIQEYLSEDLRYGGIIHYIGPVKPWNYPPKRDSALSAYYRYWNFTPFKWFKLQCCVKSLKALYLDIFDYKSFRMRKMLSKVEKIFKPEKAD